MEHDDPPSFQPDPGALKLKKRENPEQEKLKAASVSASKSTKAAPKKKKKKPGKASGSARARLLGLALGPFLLGIIVLGLFLAHQVLDWEILSPEQARLTRNIGIVAFLAVIILEAFTEDLMQGILCLFLPPYTFMFGVFFTDAGPLRGLTVAVLFFFGAEMYFTPEEALVPAVQTTVNDWIRSGQDKLIYPDGRPEAGFE